MADWSNLPEELLMMIVVRLFSVLELLRFRSVCTSWRSLISDVRTNTLPRCPLVQLNPLVVTLTPEAEGVVHKEIIGLDRGSFLSRATFFRVSVPSSSPGQGWLIKYEREELRYGRIPLVNPLSRFRWCHWWTTFNLLTLRVSEIQASYIVKDRTMKVENCGFKRVVLCRNNVVLGVGCDGKIRYWNGEVWTRVKEQVAQFCDVTVHKGLTYALDSNGIVWWICSSLNIYRYGPSLDGNVTNDSHRDLNFVECGGELYIVDRIFSGHYKIAREVVPPHYPHLIHDDVEDTKWDFSRGFLSRRTFGFKVYKMDEELCKWVEVDSLGDNAFVMATDCCFSVLAHEFYGCLKNSIYFSDKEKYELKVFKLDDGSIVKMSRHSQSSFQMFLPTFR